MNKTIKTSYLLIILSIFLLSLFLILNNINNQKIDSLTKYIEPTNQLAAVSSTIENGLIGWWKLDEGSGTSAGDSSGSGNNGNLLNGAIWTQGKIGGGVSFDGVDDMVSLPNNFSQYLQPTVDTPSASMPSFSLSIWVNRIATVNPLNIIFGKRGANSGILEGTFYLWSAAGQRDLSYSSPSNTWYMATMSYDNQTQIASCYVNGVLVGTLNMVGQSFKANLGTIGIGKSSDKNQWPFKGIVDDARIYNRALSSSEIQELYTYTGSVTPPPVTPPPVTPTPQASDTTAPSIPSNLSSSNISQTSFTLNWNASTDSVGVTGYKIYQNGNQISTSNTNSYSVSGLTAGTSYTYTVSSYDAVGNTSSQSSSLNVTTLQNVVVTPPPVTPPPPSTPPSPSSSFIPPAYNPPTTSGTYSLVPGPYTVENLGSVMSVNSIDRPSYFKIGNDVHLILFYLADYGVNPFQILDVNLTKGTSVLKNGASLGRIGPRSTVLYNNGNVYISSGVDGKGYFSEYNPTTGSVRQIALTTGNSPGQWVDIGDDGWIYIGGFPNAFVDRYNPNTNTYERLGNIDVANTGADYAYSLGADSRYVYIGLGKAPWSLSVYDTVTKNTVSYWGNEGDTLGYVRKDSAGKWYYARRNSSSIMSWYEFENGVPKLTSYTGNNPRAGLSLEGPYRGGVYDGLSFGYMLGYETNLDEANPDSSNNSAIIKYKKIGDSTWQSVTVNNFRLAPIGVSRLYPWNSEYMLGFSSFYGPVYLWNINTNQTKLLGYPQSNLYNAIFNQNTAYFSGYDAITLKYNSTRPWTLTPSTSNKFDTSINPYQVKPTIATHNYYTVFGNDGYVYMGVHHDRPDSQGNLGGELGWHNPSTNLGGSIRAPFINYDISDLKTALGGSKIIYVSNKDKIFVIDSSTKSIEKTFTPLPGINMDKVVEVEPGIIFGVTGNNIFKMDISTGNVIYNKVLTDKAFQESIGPVHRRLTLGPDGYIWMFRWMRDQVLTNKSSIYRINPVDGSYTIVLADTFSKYGENNIVFSGTDMYLYGGPILRRIKNILVKTSDTTPSTPTAPVVTTPLDSDSDGIANISDKCPNTPRGVRVNNYGCAIPLTTKFTITNNIDNADLNSITSFNIGNSLGRIMYNIPVSLIKTTGDRLDIDSHLSISKGYVSLDSTKVPELNKGATVTLYNITATNPKIMKDGVLCTTCTIVSYTNGTLVFTVPSF